MATGRFKCKVPRVCLPGCLCGCIPAACMYCRCECMCVCICGCVGIEHEQHLHMQVCNTRQDIAEVLEEVDGDVNVRGRVQELNRRRGHHQAAVVFVCVCVCVCDCDMHRCTIRVTCTHSHPRARIHTQIPRDRHRHTRAHALTNAPWQTRSRTQMGNLALAASRARQKLEENGDGVHDAHGGTELLHGDGGSSVCVCCLRSCIRVWIHNVCMYKQVTSGSWTKMRPGQGAQMR